VCRPAGTCSRSWDTAHWCCTNHIVTKHRVKSYSDAPKTYTPSQVSSGVAPCRIRQRHRPVGGPSRGKGASPTAVAAGVVRRPPSDGSKTPDGPTDRRDALLVCVDRSAPTGADCGNQRGVGRRRLAWTPRQRKRERRAHRKPKSPGPTRGEALWWSGAAATRVWTVTVRRGPAPAGHGPTRRSSRASAMGLRSGRACEPRSRRIQSSAWRRGRAVGGRSGRWGWPGGPSAGFAQALGAGCREQP
jgi:hypothetical protein